MKPNLFRWSTASLFGIAPAQLCLGWTLLLGLTSSAAAQAVPDAGMLRFPDVSAKRIVFVYSGDLWTVPREGGVASPMASPQGGELNPRFSPDGSQVAFVGNYGGGSDLYITPTMGGVAKRMTYHPARETLCDWTPEGGLLYSTNGFSGLGRMPQLYTVSDDAPNPTQMPVPYGSNGAISEDGQWLAYTPYSRDGRTWKRYRGGMASDIWLLHLESKRSKQITDWEGTDSIPMWHGQTVYYMSDAGPKSRLNIWKYDTNTGAKEQITKHADYDVKWPSIGPGTDDEGEIVYQQGSSLWLLNLASGESKAVEVSIPGDRPQIRPQMVDMSNNIRGASISPTGKRVAVEARGDIWTLPAKNGTPRNLTGTSGVAERSPSWSPDGRWIVYLSDATGEYELVLQQSDGKGETRRLTNDGSRWRYSATWSPDSKHLVFTDNSASIYLHDIEAKKTQLVDTDPSGQPPEVRWSHDSGWLTYSKAQDSYAGNGAVWVYQLETSELHQLTSGYFNDTEPCFDRKGDFLYFVSNRRFSSPSYDFVGSTFIYDETSVMLALPLRADVKNPLLSEVDRVKWDDEDDKDEDDAEDGDSESDDDGEDSEDDSDDPAEQTKSSISGSWTVTVDSELIPAEARTVTMLLQLDGDGELSGSILTGEGESLSLSDPKFDAETGAFSTSVETPMGTAALSGTLEGDTISGSVTIKAIGLVADFQASREASEEMDSDEADESSKEKTEKKSDKKDKEEKKPLVIEFENAERRVIVLPIGTGDFSGLSVNSSGHLIFNASGGDEPRAIKIYDINADKPKVETIVTGGGGWELSANGKKLLLIRGSSLTITGAAAGKGAGDKVSTDGMDYAVDPRQEWEQIFTDAWRMQRDFFYDPNMHGVDWDAVKKRYSKLLADASSRGDVAFIISEMISEINVGHAYYRGARGGSAGSSVPSAVLGCQLEISDGRFKIAEFWQGAVWDTDAQSPLQVAGAKQGQYILDIEGRKLTADVNAYASLVGLGGKLVTLTLSDDATLDVDDKRIDVRLPGNDSNLRFRHWIEKNRAYVDEKSDGRVGYIFVTNTGQPGQNDLFRQFYAQMGKDALIIDDRWNGGGQIPNRFIELLNRPASNMWARRHGKDWRWPQDSHQGPKCMLINGLAGSGGDMFPALFRRAKLGKLIGRRTWGGLVGITGGPQLIDGASVTVPSFAYYELDGTWGIEGHGVDPDIDVIDDPALMQDGGDPQLDAAIEHMQQELETKAFVAPKRPDYPVRDKMGITAEDR